MPVVAGGHDAVALGVAVPRVLHLEAVAADAAGDDEDEHEEGADDADHLLQLQSVVPPAPVLY